MITGKIIRNKPLQIEQNFYQSEYQPLRRVLSNNQLMQTCPSYLQTNLHEELADQRERQGWGSAKEYVEKCERRMRERVAAIQRRYNLSLQELQSTLEEKDSVIRELREMLEEKQATIQSMRKENQMALKSSRLMASERSRR